MNHHTHKITAETLTPIHIGSGNELNGNFEYLLFPDVRQLAIVDTNKILDIIGSENINHWVSIVDNDEDLLTYLYQRKKNLIIEDVAERIIEITNTAPIPSKNKLKEQLHLGITKQPTVPGSSLKGSMRTAILKKLIKDNASFAQKNENLEHKYKKNTFDDSKVQAHYLGATPNKDLLRFLRVSDLVFHTNTCVVQNNIINQFRNSWGEKKEQTSYWECIPSGIQAEGNIQIPEILMQRVQEKHFLSGKYFGLLTTERLFKVINEHTLLLIQNELEFWEDENNPLAIGDYMEHLTHLKEQLKSTNTQQCILRVGAGGGWDFMTGGWAAGVDVYEDHILSDDTWVKLKRSLRKKRYNDNTIFPKTRKLIEGGLPLGFLKLTLH